MIESEKLSSSMVLQFVFFSKSSEWPKVATASVIEKTSSGGHHSYQCAQM